MDDLILIEKVKKEQCSDSLVELAKRHDGLFRKITARYLSHLNLTETDIDAEKLIVLWRCCETFDNNKKSKFTTWYANQVRFCWLNKMRKESKNILNFSLPMEDAEIDKISLPTDENGEILDIIEREVNNLPENDRQIIKSRYNTLSNRNSSWQSVAEITGMSGKELSKRHKSNCKIIKNKLKEYGI